MSSTTQGSPVDMILEFQKNFSPMSYEGWLFLRIVAIWCVLEVTLRYIQHLSYDQHKNQIPPELRNHLDPATFERSRNYGKDSGAFDAFTKLFKVLLVLFLFYNGAFKSFWNFTDLLTPSSLGAEYRRVWRHVYFALFFVLLFSTVDLLINSYNTFVIEKSYGFNRQTPEFFLRDHLKKIMILIPLGCYVAATTEKKVDTDAEESSFLVNHVAGLISMEIGVILMSEVILPFFLTYSEVPAGTLRAGMEALANRVDFPVEKIVIVDASKRTSHTTAAFLGFICSKRIFLPDTLFERGPQAINLTEEEIEAILAHELGHWKLKHAFIRYEFSLMYHALAAGMFAFFVEKFSLEAEIEEMEFILAAIVTWVGSGGLVMNWLGRQLEFEADWYAVQLGYRVPLKSALIKIYTHNLAFPIVDPWYQAWFGTHPTLIERMKAVDNARIK